MTFQVKMQFYLNICHNFTFTNNSVTTSILNPSKATFSNSKSDQIRTAQINRLLQMTHLLYFPHFKLYVKLRTQGKQ